MGRIKALEHITEQELSIALSRVKNLKKSMDLEELNMLAKYVMQFFGIENMPIIDNILNDEDRDVFYMLEDEGLLKTGRDEVTIKKGKVWRIYYWELNYSRLDQLVCGDDLMHSDSFGVGDADCTVYARLPEDMWTNRAKS